MIELLGLDAPAAPGSPVAALRGVHLRVQAGEQLALVGASGAGKTSLLLALAAATRPLAGQVRLFGQDPWALRSAARQRLRARLCLAPQQPPLPPRQRVVTAVLAGRLPAWGLARSLATLWQPGAQAALAAQALADFGLADKLWSRVDRLSGGERQRVGLARLRVSQAPLWLVDEPLSALDPVRAGQALAALQDAARAEGRTLVCSLHQVALARSRFARVVALQAGRVVYDGPPEGFDEAGWQALYAATAEPAGPAASADGGAGAEPACPQALCR
ncbi:ATP-binding cassette domain-containing protein [Ideonella sp.]|uniref:ATP-binding cassette domain-containing protein n=1 Tax=Ideonella sp. TaxID=1929293 RepID=UPI0035AEC1C5